MRFVIHCFGLPKTRLFFDIIVNGYKCKVTTAYQIKTLVNGRDEVPSIEF